MEILNYIMDNSLVMIPVLVILGQIIKHVEKIPDKFIPLILLAFGVAGGLWMTGLSLDGIIQGVLVTGAAVYGNQLVKQLQKTE